MWGDTVLKSFFRGSSLEFRAVGFWHLHLTETDEHIIIKRPDNSANNLIMGTLYVDVHGTMEVTNITKNIKVVLNVTRQGWTTKNAYKVEGNVLDANSKPRYEIEGKWNEGLSIKNISTGKEEQILKVLPKPENSIRMYGFSKFSCNMNYIDDEMRQSLPPTDCRRRNDQRLMEEGDYDKAADEKHRLEEK